MIKLWDLATRLFHWSLAIAFCLSVYSGFQDKIMTGYDMLHQRAGIVILILVIFRLIWGVVGSETARFTSFVQSPKVVIAYLRGQKPAYVGHNPLGALSVVAMLLLLLAQAVLGLFSTDAMTFDGPLSHLVSDPEQITAIHRILGLTLIGLVGLHLLAILFYRVRKKDDLVTPMITGRKRLDHPQPVQKSQALALLLFLLSGALVCLSVFQFS